MALVVLSIDRDKLPPHTDDDFREWVSFCVGERPDIDCSNPLWEEDLDADVREIG